MASPNETTTKMGPLFTALAEAGKAADAVGRDAHNAFHKYDYTSAEAIYKEVRAALHAHGLALVPVTETLSGDAEKGYCVDLAYMLTHSSGESMMLHRTWPVVPDRGRPLDKALAGALTTALAYLGRDLLMLPRADEEVDRREDKPHSPEKAPTKRSPVKPQKPAAPPVVQPEADALRAQIAELRVPAEWRPQIGKDVVAAGADVAALREILDAVRESLVRAEASS